jgi:N-acetylneuraminic acid mutarotase
MLAAFASAADTLIWTQLSALPEPHGVAGAFAGISGGALIVACGAEQAANDRAFALDFGASIPACRDLQRLPGV